MTSSAPRHAALLPSVRSARAALVCLALLTLPACEDDPARPTGSSLRPLTELVTENGSAISLGTIPLRPDEGIDTGPTTLIEVNVQGQAAGYATVYRQEGVIRTESNVGRAAYWSGSQMIEIPFNYGPATSNCIDDQSLALALNDNATVVGFWDHCNPNGQARRAFSWSNGSQPVELATPVDGWSIAYDINGGGRIAGVLAAPPDYAPHAVVWNDALSYVPLPDMTGHSDHSAQGINDKGDVVGAATDENGVRVALLWPAGGGVTTLPLPAGWSLSDIVRINNAGMVVGYGYDRDAPGTQHVFLWSTACGGRRDLGAGTAIGIDDGGRLVGTASFGAFVWTAEAGMTPLGLASATGIGNGGHVVGQDAEGGAALTRISIVNPNQAATPNTGGPYVISEGQTVNLDARGTSSPDQDALCFLWNFGGGLTSQGPTTSRFYDDNGSFPFTLDVIDAQGATGTASGTVTVNNVAPTARFSAPAAGYEGTPLTISLTNAFDPSAADVAAGFEYAFDCGGAAGLRAFGPANSRSCRAPNEGTRVMRAQVRDKDGGITEYTASVVIANVAPVVTIEGPDPQTGLKNAPFTVSFHFDDPGLRDRWSYRVDFGVKHCNPVIYDAATQPALVPGTTYKATCAAGYGQSPTPYTISVQVNDGVATGSDALSLKVTK